MGTPTSQSEHDNASPSRAWHALSAAEVEQQLDTGPGGLDDRDAASRLESIGPNVIQEEESTGRIALLASQFRSPLIFILVAAALATTVLQEYIDTAVIATVLLLNAAIGYTQERKAEESVRGLRQLVAPQSQVLRNDRKIQLDSADLVPGDLVLFESGTRVPGDIRVTRATSLMVDESLITGESVPVQKQSDEIEEDVGVSDRINMLYSGATVTSGRGQGYVVATGAETELGGIAELIRTSDAVKTPLQQRMDRFAKMVGVAVLGSTLLAFALGLVVGISASEMFMVGVGLAVATVPEGLPIIFTVTLAIGVHRMAQRNAIVRRLPAVETLGSASVIGSDKTGTLTENRMTVQSIWTPDDLFAISSSGENGSNQDRQDGLPEDLGSHPGLRAALLAGVMTSEASIEQTDDGVKMYGDPTETALLTVSADAGIDPEDARRSHDVLAEIPFESDLRYSASLRNIDGTSRLFVKGAPERILDMSGTMFHEGDVIPVDRERIEREADDLAARGLRVIAGAVADLENGVGENGELDEPGDLTFAGMFGLLDPPRAGVKEAIAGCQEAGVRVIMITGDHSATASAIAADLGISELDSEVLSGSEIEKLKNGELDAAVARVNVFARVSPEHKQRVVEACIRAGEIVGVTGDGVNDAPALKSAHIGIAMGKSGTDVAREASDMVLADDNFVSIYSAVEQGRVTFDNVRKVTFFLISTAISLPLTILSAIVLGWPIPFLPAQLLWINLVTNGLQDVALAFEPGEPDTLKQKPRSRDEGIISSLLWKRSVATGLVLSAGTLFMFWWELDRSGSLVQAQSVALTTMVMFQMFHVVNARSDYRSVFRLNPLSNPYLLLAMVFALAIHIGALYFGPAQFVLRVEPISLQAWMYILPMTLSIIAVVEIHKLLRPRGSE